jgi:hypothetical protein
MPQPLTEHEIIDSSAYEQYLEARTEIMRLKPFLKFDPIVETYEAIYQRHLVPRLERI